MWPTQIDLVSYGLGHASKGGCGSGFPMPTKIEMKILSGEEGFKLDMRSGVRNIKKNPETTGN